MYTKMSFFQRFLWTCIALPWEEIYSTFMKNLSLEGCAKQNMTHKNQSADSTGRKICNQIFVK